MSPSAVFCAAVRGRRGARVPGGRLGQGLAQGAGSTRRTGAAPARPIGERQCLAGRSCWRGGGDRSGRLLLRCVEWDLLIEVVGAAVLAALLTAAGLVVVLLLGWALWRASGVVATDPHAAVFVVFVVVVLVLAVVLVAVLA